MTLSIEEFLTTPERRRHTIDDLKIAPIVIHEMTLQERKVVIETAGRDGVSEEEQLLVMCEAVLKAIFGYDREYTEEQCLALTTKYSSEIVNKIFDRVLSFNEVDIKAIDKAKKP